MSGRKKRTKKLCRTQIIPQKTRREKRDAKNASAHADRETVCMDARKITRENKAIRTVRQYSICAAYPNAYVHYNIRRPCISPLDILKWYGNIVPPSVIIISHRSGICNSQKAEFG